MVKVGYVLQGRVSRVLDACPYHISPPLSEYLSVTLLVGRLLSSDDNCR